MRIRRLIIIPGIAAVALVGMALATASAPPASVHVDPVARHALVSTAIGNGQLRPAKRADVESEVGGRVIALYVHEGSIVKPGDPLAQVDRTHAEMAVSKALASLGQARAGAAQVRANLLQAQAGLRRAEGVAAGTGLLAAADLEQAHTQANGLAASYESTLAGVRAAEAALGDARDALEKTTIVAPIGGTVTRLRVRLGETLGGGASPSSTVGTIADLSTIDAVVSVSEADLPRVHVGDSVSVKVEAFARARLAGRVSRIGVAALGATGRQSAMYEIVVALAPTDRLLYSDLSVTAEIVTDRRNDILGVPLLAVVMRDWDGRITSSGRDKEKGKATDKGLSRRKAVEGVFLVRDGRAEFRAVRTGIMGDQYVEILLGLEAGERVIVGPYQLIRDLETGAEVDVDNADDVAPVVAKRR
jgi:HlyD family secretion protein